MTQYPTALASFGTPIALPLFTRLRGALAAARARAADRARLRAELESYSDRQLNDLGLSREDIADVIDGRYRA